MILKVLGPSGRGLRAPRAEVPVVGRTWRETQYTQPAPRTLLLDTQAHTLTQSVRPTRTSIYSLAHLKRKTGIQSRGGHLNSIQSDIRIYSDSDSYACAWIFLIRMKTN